MAQNKGSLCQNICKVNGDSRSFALKKSWHMHSSYKQGPRSKCLITTNNTYPSS